MTKIDVDIATRFLGKNEDIYIIRPGERFSLYKEFLKREAIFLDFPDLKLDLSKPKPSREALREAVVRSMNLGDWYNSGRLGPSPSRNPQDYLGAANGRRIGRYVGAVERLYYDLKPGTIVMVPGPGYFSDTLIAELVGEPTEISNVEAYSGESFLARRVRWIGRKPKAWFSAELRERLQKPIPLMAVARSLRAEVLEASFDQYSIGDVFSSRLRTTKSDFSTLDDYNIQTVLNYVSGVLVAVDEQRPLKNIGLEEALDLLSKRRDLIPELTSNINSPGDLRLFSQRVTPLVAGLVFAIAINVPVGAKPSDIHVTNSAVAGGDPCALVVQEQAMTAIKMMDLDTWNKICVRARDAHKATGLSTSIKVVVRPKSKP